MTKIIAPLSVWIEKNRFENEEHIINLNKYRNWHHIVNNKIKKAYSDALFEQLYKLILKTPISLEFVLYKARNGKIDRSNVLSIHEKFFCDALVNYGCIPDDNDDYIEDTKYRTGGVDKDNPRVEIIIKNNYENNSTTTQ